MKEDQTNTISQLETFFNEIKILASLSHKNIVKIVYVNLDGEYKHLNGNTRRVSYYVMKYAEYGELFEILQQFETFPEKLARQFFHQLIQGKFFFLFTS